MDIPILKVTHDAGFFSCAGYRLLKIIEFYNENQILPLVDSSSQWSLYKDKAGDISNILFVQQNIDLYNFKNIKLGETLFCNEQFLPYSNFNFGKIKPFIKIYFSVSKEILDIKRRLVQKYDLNLDNLISVCFRGGDKRIETTVPSYEEMLNKIMLIKKEAPNHRILLQTDEIEFYDFIKENLPDIITFDEIPRVKKTQEGVHFHIPVGRRLNYAMTFLAIIQILSKSDYVILNSGNVGMWITLYRNNTNNLFQFLNNRWV